MSVPVREEMVNNAIEFLQDSRVGSSPEEKKRRFLSSRGMTEEEISEAFRRVGQQPQAQTQAAFPPQQLQQQYPPQQQVGYYGPPPSPAPPPGPLSMPWRSLGILLIICGGIGSTLHHLLRKYVMPWLRLKVFKASPQLSKKAEALEKLTKKVKDMSKEVKESSEKVSEGLKFIREFISIEKENSIKLRENIQRDQIQDNLKLDFLKNDVLEIKQLIPALVQKIPPPPVDPAFEKKAKKSTVPWLSDAKKKTSSTPDWLTKGDLKLDFLKEDTNTNYDEANTAQTQSNDEKSENDKEDKNYDKEKESENEVKDEEKKNSDEGDKETEL